MAESDIMEECGESRHKEDELGNSTIRQSGCDKSNEPIGLKLISTREGPSTSARPVHMRKVWFRINNGEEHERK